MLSPWVNSHVASSGGARRLVAESWRRSRAFRLDPDAAPVVVDLADDELRDRRSNHPLARVQSTIDQLLVRHTTDRGLIVAIGDQHGRLLWVDGDPALRRRAEAMAFVAGADWSERAAGTSAPGTALALGRAVQIVGAEHFNRTVHPWSCSAVPVHDRSTGAVIGVIDITGGDDAVGPVALPLLEATVAAVEAELQLLALRDRSLVPASRLGSHLRSVPTGRASTVSAMSAVRPTSPVLQVLGRTTALLVVGGRSVQLSARHAEILTLLSWHDRGLSAEELALAVYGRPAVVTLRAEMVRLRKALDAVAPQLVPLSRPYRLPRPVELDAHRVLASLDRGAHRVALDRYVGPLLPESTAPGVEALRAHVSLALRESLLSDAGVDTLLAFARLDECADDTQLWTTCLRLLPARSPRRAGVVAHLEALEVSLA